MANHEQVREGCKHVHLVAILRRTRSRRASESQATAKAAGRHRLDYAEEMLTFRADVSLLQAEAVPAGAVLIRSSSRPSGVSLRARRLPDRIARRKPIALPLSPLASRFPGSG